MIFSKNLLKDTQSVLDESKSLDRIWTNFDILNIKIRPAVWKIRCNKYLQDTHEKQNTSLHSWVNKSCKLVNCVPHWVRRLFETRMNCNINTCRDKTVDYKITRPLIASASESEIYLNFNKPTPSADGSRIRSVLLLY